VEQYWLEKLTLFYLLIWFLLLSQHHSTAKRYVPVAVAEFHSPKVVFINSEGCRRDSF